MTSLVSDDAAEAGHRRWRERRFRELSAPDSWLGLTGLYWLEPGVNTVGSAPGSNVLLPAGPVHLGDLSWAGGRITWRSFPEATVTVEGGVEEGDELVLRTDAAGEPSRLRHGDLEFFVIERDGRPAVRLRDLAWRQKRDFAGVECYPFDPAWVVQARWEKLPEPVAMEVQNVTGELKTVTVSFQAAFCLGDSEQALLPLDVGDGGVFFIFRDATSGRETYGAGRFLRAKPPVDGSLVLDFNRAINPPCAFTTFATCSLAPPENRLPVAVRAGERKYVGSY